jgi:UDP-N-acetylglucosamine 2-epimerase (non-hydrolysing)
MLGIILGTRPEIIKLYPLIKVLLKKKFNFNIIHTGQHYSNSLNDIFLDQFKIPKKKIIYLKVISHLHGEQTALMTIGIEKLLKSNSKIKALLVYGDTNSALAASLAACKFPNIKIIHLEAGLRSFDKYMPEEINRRLIDHSSDLLLCPTQTSKNYLINEGINKEKIFVSGNTIVDAIKSDLVQNELNNEYKSLRKKNYIVLTIHREENTLNSQILKKIIYSVKKISKELNYQVIFPIHPKTKKLINQLKIKFDDKFNIIEPLDYVSFLKLIKKAKIIISDSGGVQEEACILRVPLVTIRNSTERPETILMKCNVLSVSEYLVLRKNVIKMLKQKVKWVNPYGNGNAALISFNIIKKFLNKNDTKFY